MNKKALVVAGGQWQKPLITFLQQKSYYVVVVDPFTDSQGVVIADEHIKLDVRDREAILEAIRDKHFDIITTDQSDISVETVAFLAKAKGVKGNSEESILRFSNKYKSRQYAESLRISIPKYCEVDTVSAIEKFITRIGLPLILKPCDSQSSKGIHLIDRNTTKKDLKKYLRDALQYSFSKKCVLEQFVSGYEITVEGFCVAGKHKTLAISKKKHFKTGIASSLTYPAKIPKLLEERIIQTNDKFVDNSGIDFAPTHAEYIVDEENDQFYLIEIACRGGGTLISSDIIKWVSGFDVYQSLLRCLEGKMVSINEYNKLQRSAILYFFDFGQGIIKCIKGLEEAKRIEGVLVLDFDYKIGDTLKSCQDDRSRQGFVIVFADNDNELQRRLQRILSVFQVILYDE